MGSLFDGIGGFPLAAIRYGITPVWASEIEAFPMAVTKIRFPDMIHVGDITKLNGAELPPVDIICGGSPCQDLSVAGKRAGLTGARAGLFMEQIRIMKEMRELTDCVEEQMHISDLDLACGKMFREPFPAAAQKGRISGLSSKNSSGLITIPYQSLDLTPGAGNLLDESYWEMLSPWRGNASMLNYVKLHIIELMYSTEL